MLSLIWNDPFVTESSKAINIPLTTGLNSITIVGIALTVGLFYWWFID